MGLAFSLMPPKRKPKKSLSETMLADGNDSDDSHISSSSMATGSSIQMSRTMSQLSIAEEPLENQIDDWIDQLNEKRTSAREAALIKLLRTMSNQYLEEFMSSRFDIIASALRKILKKDKVEACLATKVLSLLWITCPENIQNFEDTIRSLQESIKNGAEELKAAAMQALGTISFLEELPNGTIVDLLQYCQTIIEQVEINPLLMQASLDTYGLLYIKASTRPDKDEFNVFMDRLMELLEDAELDVRISSGENIALLLEDRNELVEQNDIQEEESYFERYHELVQMLNSMSNDSTRYRSKKDRSIQRASFRDIAQSVKTGEPPDIKLQFKSETVYFDSWSKLRILELFRNAIGEGLSVHFQQNPTVQQYFQFTESVTKGMDRRVLDVTVKKSRSIAKKELRTAKSASQRFH